MKKIIPLLIIALILFGSFMYLNNKYNSDSSDKSAEENQTDNNSIDNNDNNAENSDIPGTDDEYISRIVYYADSNGYLVPVLRKLPKNISIAKTAISSLYENNNNKDEVYHMGLVPTIPEGVTIILALKEDGLIKVSMSSEVMDIKNRGKEDIMLKSIIYTLTEFDNISKVEFMIDKTKAGVLTGGAIASGTFLREDINVINTDGKNRINLYYCNEFYPNYYVFPITVYLDTVPSNAEDMLNQLINNIEKVNTTLDLKKENIVCAEVKGENATIELTDIEGDSIYIESVRKCIALSLQENFSVTKADIIINGASQSIELPIAPNEM